MILPILILEEHVRETSRNLSRFLVRVSDMEKKIASISDLADSGNYLKTLNEYHLEGMKLDRRWRFETDLANNLLSYFDSIQTMTTHNTRSAKFYPPVLRQRVESRLSISNTHKYDLEILPRRINAQTYAVSHGPVQILMT